MAKLRLTLMVHIESDMTWNGTPLDPKADPRAMAIGQLSTVIGINNGRGAKLSVQFDRRYLDVNDAVAVPYPGGVTSLKMILENGGNFWCHTHSGSYTNLLTIRTCVASAVASELGISFADAESHSAGRSAGADINDPSIDWVSITVHAGIRRMNSTVLNYYATLVDCLRPYGMTNADIQGGVYHHDTAPGPLDDRLPTTMRQRPFYVNSSSFWDAGLTTCGPHTNQVGSLMMIPHPGRAPLNEYAGGRGTGGTTALTVEDFNAALTEIWNTYQGMNSYQNSITNVWYVHVPPDLIRNTPAETFGAWVDSINAILEVGGANPKGAWNNFNEIASLYATDPSFYF